MSLTIPREFPKLHFFLLNNFFVICEIKRKDFNQDALSSKIEFCTIIKKNIF